MQRRARIPRRTVTPPGDTGGGREPGESRGEASGRNRENRFPQVRRRVTIAVYKSTVADMRGHGLAGALWYACRSLLLGLLVLSALGLMGPGMARAALIYDYVGQQFDGRAPNCRVVECVDGGNVTGTVTFNVPENYTGVLFGGVGISGFSLHESGTGGSTSYPCSGTCGPFSVLDSVYFRDGVIIKGSLYTRGPGTVSNPFGGSRIDIGTGYGGDVVTGATDSPDDKIIFGYSDGPGTWTKVAGTPGGLLYTVEQKIAAGIFSTVFKRLSQVLDAASVVADGPKKAAVNSGIFVLKQAVSIFGDEETGKSIDVAAQLRSIYQALTHFAETVKQPLSLLFDVASTYLALASDVLNQVRIDPPDPNFTVLAAPADLGVALPAALSSLPDYPVFATLIHGLQTCTSLWDAQLTAAQRYQGALLAGDMTSASAQASAFVSFTTQAATCPQTLSQDLSAFANTLQPLDLSGFDDVAAEIGKLVAAQCGTQLPAQLAAAMESGGISSGEIDSLVCQAADQFDPSLVQPDIAAAFSPAIDALGPQQTDVAEPDSLSLLVLPLIFGAAASARVRKQE